MMPPAQRLTSRRVSRRPKVVVLYEDVVTGFKCADRCALHGYQATLASSPQQAERDLQDLHPDAVIMTFVDPALSRSGAVPRIRSLWPQVPIIAMMPNESRPNEMPRRSGGSIGIGADVFLCRSLDVP
ncbi:MAG: hypothetical protein L6Q34_03255 [Nitrospira sp.]|nr:hypothetical protein [Nitrospira sp.]MEB2339688.1 hypothetical protein [Nitrospirales bacterium]QOJ34099.1 MAG: hypothetical protein HRU82_03645 [Nitrospira sp.]